LLGTALLAGVGSVAASRREPNPTPSLNEPDLNSLRARADAQLAAFAATLPASERPGPQLAAAYREAYVATVTRKIEPCGAKEVDPFGPPHPLLRDTPPSNVPAVVDTDTVSVWGKVFLDLNADGVLDLGEPGIRDIAVSNGTAAGPLGNGVKLTNPDGSYNFLTPLPNSRFVFVTVPGGYTATTPFFHRLAAAANPDTVHFGLRLTPETADPVFRWVQISDTHVVNDGTAIELSDDLSELEGLPLPPDFVVVTGDLVNTGSIDTQFQSFLNGISGHSIPLHVGYGDHDSDGSALEPASFENFIGPSYYSFEYGGVHFVMYNDIDPADASGEFIQFPWLFQDLTFARARDPQHSIPIVICKHTMPLANETSLYNQLGGVIGAFSGHWHGSRVRLLHGIFDVNTPPMRFAGIDKASRGFRINDVNNGAIQTVYRLAGINDQIQIALPANGDTVLAGPVTVRVNGYDSQDPLVSGLFHVDGPISTGNLPLTQDGPWAWQGTWDAAQAPSGSYTLTAELTPDLGAPLVHTIDLLLTRGTTPAPDPFTDWPCYKHDPAGTGYTSQELAPPLRVAWVQYLGGRNNVESPAVAGGRVYVGTSNISTVNEAAMNCFDAVSGTLLWRFPARTDVKSTPAIAGGRVFFTNSIGTLFALDAASGALLWDTQLGDSLTRWEMTSPVVHSGIVYAGGLPAMSAVDATNGDILWQEVAEVGAAADFIPAIYSAPAVNDTAVVFTTKGGIFAFDPVSGAPLWQYTGGSKLHRSAAILNGLAYSAGGVFGNQRLIAYNLATGDTTYIAQYGLSDATSAPVVAPNRVIVAHGGDSPGGFPNGLMEGWSPTLDFDLEWLFDVGSPISSSRAYQRATGSINSTPAIAGAAAVYFGADDGHLYALNPATGAELWRFNFGVPVRSSPAIAGNMLFVTTEDGSLYAFTTAPIAITAIDPAAAPLRTALRGNRPNPFNPATTIYFDLGPAGAPAERVTLRIVDSQGRVVRHLIDAKLPSGHHTAHWDGLNDRMNPAASGVYFYILKAGEQTFSDRMVMVR
jgi:outer membrane protein assembly factor BamB